MSGIDQLMSESEVPVVISDQRGTITHVNKSFGKIFHWKTEDLEKALAREDTELISRLAHKIKGSALNLRLDLMGKPAANIERAAKEGDLSRIAGDWDILRREFEAIGGKGKRDGTST